MTKLELVKKIGMVSDLHQHDVHCIVEHLFYQLAQSMERGESVYIRGFGTFKTRLSKAKIGRNVRTNTEMLIKERTVPVFKPSKVLKLHVEQKLPF